MPAPENVEAWELWQYVRTQWRTSFGGLVGLDYPAVYETARVLDIEMTPGLLDKIRIMERLILARQRDKTPTEKDTDEKNPQTN